MTATQFCKLAVALNITFERAAAIVRPEEMPSGKDIAREAEEMADSLTPSEAAMPRHMFLHDLANTASQYA